MKKEAVYSIPDEVANVAKTLENKGFHAYLIGGCTRDLILGRKPKDWDITTNAKPEEIISLFSNTFYENEYGTVGVVNESVADESLKVIEVTPYRVESQYSNKRHPDSVSFGTNLDEDLKRRDFSINAIALKITGAKGHNSYIGHLVDNHNGIKDIENRVINTVGNPEERLFEDALRMLRAIRISAELGFSIGKETGDATQKHSKLLGKISRERIRDEFVRIIMSDRPSEGIINCQKYGLLSVFLPELENGMGVKQNKAHAYDVWEHSLKTLAHSAKNKWPLEVRLAALLHDIGKIPARRWSDEKSDWTFHGHDVIGSKIVQKILTRLMFPVKTVNNVSSLVRWHMFFSDTDQITLSSVRRLLRNVGKDHIWDLMNVRMSDRIGTGRPKESPYRLRKYKSMIEEVMHDPLTVQMLKIDGNTVMQVTREKPGPRVGYILHALLDEVLEDPKLNNSEYLEKRSTELSSLSETELEQKGNLGKAKRAAEEDKAIKQIRDRHWVK